MKTRRKNRRLTIYRAAQPPFPNAADHRYFANRAVDILSILVSGLGFVCAMLFLAAIA